MICASRPNFVLINTDQHRGDCFSFTKKRTGLVTPHLDNLAMRGMRFNAAYSTCPVCVPQRMSLMSGQLQSTHGCLHNSGTIPYWPIEHTLPGELRDHGYQTALIGRDMHLCPTEMGYGFEHQEICTAHQGCDYVRFLAQHSSPLANGMWGQRGAIQSWIPSPWHLEPWLHYTEWTTDQAIRWLYNRDPSRSFFLTVGYNQPHVPNNPPANYLERYERMSDLGKQVVGDWAVPPANNGFGLDLDNCPYVNLEGVNQHRCFAGYYGSINHLDDSIGRLLAFLKVSGLIHSTYIIFTADHGELLGDHYLFHKSFPYEGSARIPLFIMGPGITGGQENDSPVGWHDLMPTILELADVPIPGTAVDGVSLATALRGNDGEPVRDYLHGECLLNSPGEPLPGQQLANNVVFEQGMQYVTDGQEKYIWYPQGGIEQYFNLQEDPGECRNQVENGAYRGRVDLWRNRLIDSLSGRPEGFVEHGALRPGIVMSSRLPHAQAQYEEWRAAEAGDSSHHHDNLMTFFPMLQA